MGLRAQHVAAENKKKNPADKVTESISTSRSQGWPCYDSHRSDTMRSIPQYIQTVVLDAVLAPCENPPLNLETWSLSLDPAHIALHAPQSVSHWLHHCRRPAFALLGRPTPVCRVPIQLVRTGSASEQPTTSERGSTMPRVVTMRGYAAEKASLHDRSWVLWALRASSHGSYL